MRNSFHTPSGSHRGISDFAAYGNRPFHFLAGSIGLFVMSAQLSQVITERIVESCKPKPVVQQVMPPIQTAAPKIKSRSGIPEDNASATSKKVEVGVFHKRHGILVEEAASAASREKEVDESREAFHGIDAQTGRRLASHVASTYKIPSAMAKEIVTATISLSQKNGMDPFLALGIIACESSFKHTAKSGYGATGLMQVYAPVHRNVLENLGVRSKNPKIVQKMLKEQIHLNVAAGIRIYKNYENQYGSLAKALQAYNGSREDVSYSYAHKVLAVREEFQKVAASAKFVSQTAESAAPA